ncbi:hypothetical protein D3C73_576370 [compost metagenome]
MQQLAKPCEVAPLLLRPGQHHDQHCAHKGGIEAQLQGVGKGLPAIDAVAVKGVVSEGQLKVVGPELHQGAVNRHPDQRQKQQGPESAPAERQQIPQPMGFGLIGHRLGAALLLHLATYPVLQRKAQQRRQQQGNAGNSAE